MLPGQEIGSTTSIQLPQALRRGQIPIAPAAPQVPHFPRFRALALFGRRPQERVDRLVNPASENLRITGRKQPQQIAALRRVREELAARLGRGVLAVLRLMTNSNLVGSASPSLRVSVDVAWPLWNKGEQFYTDASWPFS